MIDHDYDPVLTISLWLVVAIVVGSTLGAGFFLGIVTGTLVGL